MPSAMGEASVWLIMIVRPASACSMAKIAPLGSRLIESPARLAIRVRPRSSWRGVVRISVDKGTAIFLCAGCGLRIHRRPGSVTLFDCAL